ncbi:response regulator [bacterium]|nr:response regulator [bacterium]
MNRKVLLVDDEPDILDAFKRLLRNKIPHDTALSGFEGLEKLASEGPYAVVVSDLQMPEMDGIQFLKKSKELYPDTVRVMLTGKADFETAIDAVNDGHIFRFLRKPCPQETFMSTLEASIQQHRLITAEKELLEKTLSGSIKMLVEVLGLVNPAAFGRAIRIKNYVRAIVKQLELTDSWQYEVAALLSQLGCVTIGKETLEKWINDLPLDSSEMIMVQEHPKIGSNLLVNIPRLGTVARMVAAQSQYKYKPDKANIHEQDIGDIGGHLLKIALHFDKQIQQGKSPGIVIEEMLENPKNFQPEAVAALKDIEVVASDEIPKSIKVNHFDVEMVLDEDIRTRNGMLVAVKGQLVTKTLLKRLRSFDKNLNVQQSFQVTRDQDPSKPPIR